MTITLPALRQKKPVPRTVELLTTVGQVPALIEVGRGKLFVKYMVTPTESDFGQAYRLLNLTSGVTYNLNLNGPESVCDCPGFSWGQQRAGWDGLLSFGRGA